MKYLILLAGFLFICSCEYTEDVTFNGNNATFVKKSKSANEGIIHFERSDGKFIAFKVSDTGGSGWDHNDCNACLGLCVVQHPDLGSEYWECSKKCDETDCGGELPKWGKDFVIVESIRVNNMNKFGDTN